jgi:RimJ/RimL family protein N-acetyltransferase
LLEPRGGAKLLEGTIVNLRRQEVSDAANMLRWVNDAEVTAALGNRYLWSMGAEEEFLRNRTTQRQGFGEQTFAIEAKNGRHIGSIGLHDVSPENRSGSLGIMIGEKDFWSQGYGTDAIVVLLRLAFGEMNLNRVELHAYADNERGIACYRKCGFVHEVTMRQGKYRDGRWGDTVEMSVLRGEFDALHGISGKATTP